MAAPTCGCEERIAAQKDGWFVYVYDRDGWVFTDGPMRRMSTLAAYYASERGVENHTGEPFVWHCCCFCGLDLPTPDHDAKWLPDNGQGDGYR